MSINIRHSAWLGVVIVCVCRSTFGQVLDDPFDDGALTTNSTGTGGGFTSFVAGGSLTETASEVVFDLSPGALQSIYSNDNLDLFTSAGTTTTFRVSGGSVANNAPFDFPAGDNGRIWFGLVTSTTNTSSFALPIDATAGRHGLWVSLYDTIDGGGFNQATLGGGTNPNDYNGQIGWVAADGTRTILAQFTYDTYLLNDPAHNAIDVNITVSSNTYSVHFAGADAGVMLRNGSLSGALPSPPSGLFKAAATIQTGGQAASASFEIDHITVTTVPEPSSIALFALCIASTALARRHLKKCGSNRVRLTT